MELVNKKEYKELPKKENVLLFLEEVKKYIFIGYFEDVNSDIETYKKKKLDLIKEIYIKYILNNFDYALEFINKLESIITLLKTDIKMTFMSDPACTSTDEIIITYPGFFAIFTYRIAHILYQQKIEIIPRMLSEYAHSITGIDIHPGATIGGFFFIDHGTGIVIGETSIIGHHVKIYHGVTLGALSLKKGQSLKGVKRHPTIGNYVTIYSGASILGGETFIGDNSTLGCNVFLVQSVPENSKVLIHVDIN